MTDFKDTMMTQLEQFRQAADTEKTVRKATVVEYKCEVSGIDMTVSRIVNGKCTMMLFIYLSQGEMFIKTMKDGTMKAATEDNVNTFFRELKYPIATGSNTIPMLRSGKEFAVALMAMKDGSAVDLAKEGFLNTEMVFNKSVPWFADSFHWCSHQGRGISDRHGKLLRRAAELLSERDNISYSAVMTKISNYRYSSDHSYDFVWSFSCLADVYDEPFAIKCLEEYIDNARLEGLDDHTFANLFENLIAPLNGGYRSYRSWKDIVEAYKAGNGIVTLDKNRLWDYVQHAIAVGYGRRLDGYIGIYGDYLTQAYRCDGKIREKYPEYLQVAHDVYSEKYRLLKEFADSEKLKARTDIGCQYIDQVNNGYELKVLTSQNQFLEEAQQNCNCVASYVDKVVKGECWIASFRPIGSPSTLLTVEINPEGRIVQIRGKCNRYATDKELELLKPFKAEILKRMADAKE